MSTFYVPLKIDFFKNKDNYTIDFLDGLNSTNELTIKLYLVGLCLYRNRDVNTNKIIINKRFSSKDSYLKRLKLSNCKIIDIIKNLERTMYFKYIVVGKYDITICFNNSLLELNEKENRFSIRLESVCEFRYLEHQIVYILTRFGANDGYIYHNFLCNVLGISSLSFERQKKKIKNIFSVLQKREKLKYFKYKKYRYYFSRD